MKMTLTDLARLSEKETFLIDLEPSELKVTPNIVGLKSLQVRLHPVKIAEAAFSVLIEAELSAVILDDHDFKTKPYRKISREEVIISQNPEVESDIAVEKDGSINFRPTILALYYDMVPISYSTVRLKKNVIAGVEIISEDEYESGHGNAFKILDSEDE